MIFCFVTISNNVNLTSNANILYIVGCHVLMTCFHKSFITENVILAKVHESSTVHMDNGMQS